MSTNNHKYGDYITYALPERFVKYYKNSAARLPVAVAGDKVPPLFFHEDEIIQNADLSGANAQGFVALVELLERPLVLSFFSIHWNDYGIQHLQHLQSLHAQVRQAGGTLLVLTSEDRKFIEPLIAQYGLTFDIIHDKDNAVAEKLGLYHEAAPIWDLVSGINEHVPVPGTYVVNPAKNIVYGGSDTYLQQSVNAEELLHALNYAANANRLVARIHN
ncbi:peroxiredoxin family protein [Chitinophaga horti]|uniref:Peroxiredoxin family protein n=1 Tax=Chitinophaga horti TaxID=2920382 RepID=A0ABY6J8I7_9BACT|nr:peroxiredoxin family protein [Chitinophaga horti]UYQ94622.1 peroxiredoxin family protein [Chitinophaga horti]